MGIFDIFGTGDQKQAAQDQIAGINQGLAGLTSNINQGNNALTTNFSAGLQPFMQNYGQAQGGVNQLTNLLGITGSPSGTVGSGAGGAPTGVPGGATGAGPGASVPGSIQATLENTPGYQFQKQQGDDAINAAEAASGKNFSGNQLLDLSKFNQGLANTTYQQSVQNLMPFLQSSNTNAAGIGGLYSGLGTNLNANFNTLGNANYGADTSIGNANANADLAGLNASGNILGALGGIGKAALGSGGISSLAAFLPMLSDERAKEDIEPVGELHDGQTVYSYRYKGDPRPQIGLMAQEVEERYPEAVTEIGGLKHVNYAHATRFAADLGRYL